MTDTAILDGVRVRVLQGEGSKGVLKKPRGRPKNDRSCGVTGQVVGSTCMDEAAITWGVAKKIGLSSRNEVAFVEGLRRSKRLSIMEDHVW